MKRLFHKLIHRRGWSINAGRIMWRAKCGKLMRGDFCSCGAIINVRPQEEQLGEIEV